jgi:hypothetical protein
MKTLHADLEALMPEPVGEIVNKYGDPHAFAERDVRYLGNMQKQAIGTTLFTADQVRAAILGATERAAKLAASLAYDAAIKYANGREVDFEQEVAAAIRGDGGRA